MSTFPPDPTTQPCHCAHTHRPGRDAVVTLFLAVVIALILLLCGVALLGVHICGDEIMAAASMWRGGWGSWAAAWSWVNTYIGGQS